MYVKETIINAHKHSSRHKDEILKSSICGCFYCITTFKADKITEWVDDTVDIRNTPELVESCALCPNCGIDAVIGDASKYPIEDKAFLEAMNRHWF